MKSVPFFSEDISALAKSIKAQAKSDSIELGHTQILNYLAKAIGHQNYQSFLAKSQSFDSAATAQPEKITLSEAVNVIENYLLQPQPENSQLENFEAEQMRLLRCLLSRPEARNEEEERSLNQLMELLKCDKGTLGAAIKEWRTSQGWLQIQLAKALDVNLTTLRRWETSDSTPRGEPLQKLIARINKYPPASAATSAE